MFKILRDQVTWALCLEKSIDFPRVYDTAEVRLFCLALSSCSIFRQLIGL